MASPPSAVTKVWFGDNEPAEVPVSEWPAEFDGTPVVFDGFESGTLTDPELNTVGFKWSSTSSQIVTENDGPLMVYDDGEVVSKRPDDMTRQWSPISGNNSMMMDYAPGSNWVEQRFYLPDPGMNGMWIAWDLKVPHNFYHVSKEKSSGENQKLLRMWTDKYSGSAGASKVGLSYRPQDEDGSSYYFTKLFGPNTNGGDGKRVEFIKVPRDLGRTMRIVVKVKFDSELDAEDGSFEVWRKWHDEDHYTKDFTHDPVGISKSQSENISGFAAGYLLGYANSPYEVQTDFLIDNFSIASLSNQI
ncbi:MAG: hypothetical protein ACTHWH_06050 [Marinobacter sp.]